MNLRFHIDAATGEPHCRSHGVQEQEVLEVLQAPAEDWPGRQGARIALGQTEGGRFLQIVYVPDPVPGSIFVVTAYQLGPKALRALRRRMRKP